VVSVFAYRQLQAQVVDILLSHGMGPSWRRIER
jgi:hypothetical protein